MRKFTIISIVLFFSLSCFSVSHAQMTGQERSNWLLGVIFKLENMRDNAIADIQKYEGAIQKCENTISKSDNIIRLAQQKGNVQAETIAREASAKALEAKRKNTESRKLAEFNKMKAEQSLARVKTLDLDHPLSSQQIESVTTDCSGRVSIQKASGEIVDAGKTQAGLLEKGDTIVTADKSSAELQFLEGRGSLKVGENSRVKMEEDHADTQVMSVLKGKVSINVEKLEKLEKLLEEKIAAYKEDLRTVNDATKQEKLEAYENYLRNYLSGLKHYAERKFEVRQPASVFGVRGTKFLVFEDDKTGTEIIVLEGSVEMKEIKGKKIIIVNEGNKAAVAKDGKLSEPQKIDLSKIERWWEK